MSAQLDPALTGAAEILETQVAGVTPDEQRILADAWGLRGLALLGAADRDLNDAAAALDALAAGRAPDLDRAERGRAATLANLKFYRA